jgi:hypothetical protein
MEITFSDSDSVHAAISSESPRSTKLGNKERRKSSSKKTLGLLALF